MESFKCPVCGKPGIPDFHKENVVCPQCKSDLSIYRVVDQIPSAKGKNVWKPISAVAILAAAVCAFFLFTNKPKADENQTNDAIDLLQTEIAMLRDSVNVLSSHLDEIKQQPQHAGVFNYIVRRGDSYWSISEKLYGTGTKAKQIAAQNGRTIQTALYVGDTLKIE